MRRLIFIDNRRITLLTSSFTVDYAWVLMGENDSLADLLRTECGRHAFCTTTD